MDYKSHQVFSFLNLCFSEILMDGFYRTSFLDWTKIFCIMTAINAVSLHKSCLIFLIIDKLCSHG